MKMRILFIVMALAVAPAFAASYNWTNADTDNDFSNFDNWSGPPTTFAGNDFYINLSGDNKAEISSTLSSNPDEFRVGSTSGATGELLISGGTNSLTNTLRVGRSGSTGIVTITGGDLSILDSYTTFADGGTAILNMTGGTLNSDRITFGQGSSDTCTLNMSGGTINVAWSDLTSPPVSVGALKMGLGNTNLNISSEAVINAEKLYIIEGGLLTMTGGTVNILGTADTNPTFDFTEATIGSMNGKILFNGGEFIVTGNYESLLDTAIANGKIYTTVAGKVVDAQYADGFTTLVIPEPVTIALLGLGAIFIRRHR